MRRAEPAPGRARRDAGEVRLQELRAQARDAVACLASKQSSFVIPRCAIAHLRTRHLARARNDERVEYDAQKPTRRANQRPSGKILSSPLTKNIAPSAVGQITATTSPISSRQEGRSRSSRTRGGMRWTRMCPDE